jgi:hypothetical protein
MRLLQMHWISLIKSRISTKCLRRLCKTMWRTHPLNRQSTRIERAYVNSFSEAIRTSSQFSNRHRSVRLKVRCNNHTDSSPMLLSISRNRHSLKCSHSRSYLNRLMATRPETSGVVKTSPNHGLSQTSTDEISSRKTDSSRSGNIKR